MTSTKRALTALATGALALPFVYAPTAAFAAPPEPPAQQDISQFCTTLPADYDPFTDDEPNTFTQAIECIAFAGIAQGGPRGLPATQYGPAFSVPRDQMASFIARMIDAADELDEGDNIEALPGYDGSNAFTDVPASNVHIQNINRLEAAGIVEGGPGGRPATEYGPGLDVTRAQMASFINRAIGYMLGNDGFTTTNDYFTDDEAFQAHEANINGIASEGIAVGDGRDIYRPGQPIQRDQMAGFIARTLAVLHEEGLISEVTEDAAQPNRVTLNSTSVQQGGAVTGTVNGASATVSGCGVTNQNLTDTNATTAGIQFSFNIPQNQAAGSCVLTFTVTDADGDTRTETETVTVTAEQAGAGSTNERPELVSATIVSTTPTLQASNTNPAGTTVRYVFDEPVTGTAPLNTAFFVYNFNDPNNPVDAASVRVDPNNNRAVLALFTEFTNDPDEPGETAANLTLATVDPGAVNGAAGTTTTNPEGDAAIGAARNSTPTAGTTAAPDLLTVDGFRSTTTTGQRAVDFTFDQIAYTRNAAGFQLVLTDGTVVTCTGPAGDVTTAGGGNVAGGNGTTEITVTCGSVGTGGNAERDGATATAADTEFFGQPVTAAIVARGLVLEDTVGNRPASGVNNGAVAGGDCGAPVGATTVFCNPLQASNTPDVASTTPDLVSATFVPDAKTVAGADVDQVIYTFDEEITAADVSATGVGFNVYYTSGAESDDATATDSPPIAASRVEGNTRQVLVTYADGTLNSAVGASVERDAVQAASGGRSNEPDEVGVANSNATQVAPGFTDAPDLTGVALTAARNGAGELIGFSATYTFDERINNGTLMTADRFYLYLASGERLVCTDAALVSASATTGDTSRQVVCTEYTFEGGQRDAQDATPAQIGSAVLGTVQDGAVTDLGGNKNPEGAAATTGGTGTRV